MPSLGGTPTTTANDNSVGGSAWTRADGDLQLADGVESSVLLASGNQSYYLLGSTIGGGGGIPIPSGATIVGVEVAVRRRTSNAAGGSYPALRDASVRIWDGSAWSGSDYADTVTDWPASPTQATYGGPADLWGLSSGAWLAMLAGTTWGVGLSVSASGGVSPSTGYIDHVSVTAYYTIVETPPAPQGGEYVDADLPDDAAWSDMAAIGVAGDDYNAPPSTDAVTLLQADSATWEDSEFSPAVTFVDASSASMLDGLADAMIGAALLVADDEHEHPSSGIELVGAAWLSGGPVCDCAGVALVTGSGHGRARIAGGGNADDPTQRFGVAQITASGHGRAAITISCQC